MKELLVLGFASRKLAEEARSLGAELDQEGVLQLDGAALRGLARLAAACGDDAAADHLHARAAAIAERDHASHDTPRGAAVAT